jgi:dolichol-phosphate mannosyltransferase
MEEVTTCDILRVAVLHSPTSESHADCFYMITVILPAYNEERALPPLLDALAEVRVSSLPELCVIVVDDGSTDHTADVVRQYAASAPWVTLIQHGHNQGLSQAIQTGFRAALQNARPDDIIVTLDADNTQPPERIPGMIQRIQEGYDVVIASRFRRGARVYGVPPLRRLYSPVMSLLFQIAFGIPGVRDYSCGFRAYRASVLQRAYEHYGDHFITERGFACMVEILLQLSRLKPIRFGEVPFTLHYDLKPTPTKMRVSRTIADTLRLAVRHRLGVHRVQR